jgi:hypothetical protein
VISGKATSSSAISESKLKPGTQRENHVHIFYLGVLRGVKTNGNIASGIGENRFKKEKEKQTEG